MNSKYRCLKYELMSVYQKKLKLGIYIFHIFKDAPEHTLCRIYKHTIKTRVPVKPHITITPDTDIINYLKTDWNADKL